MRQFINYILFIAIRFILTMHISVSVLSPFRLYLSHLVIKVSTVSTLSIMHFIEYIMCISAPDYEYLFLKFVVYSNLLQTSTPLHFVLNIWASRIAAFFSRDYGSAFHVGYLSHCSICCRQCPPSS